LESQPRGIYCGSIGYIAPNQDAVFSVAIRTLVNQSHQSSYCIGSGLVSDSELEKEYEECLSKAQVLERSSVAGFELLESMVWKKAGGFYLFDLHMQRMSLSAQYFSYEFNAQRTKNRLNDLAMQWHEDMRVRLLLSQDGILTIEAIELEALPRAPLSVSLAREAVDANNPFLFHKTTSREVYENAVGQYAADDVLLFNQFGEVTESCIANIAIKVGENWITPPVHCGLLNGTMRQHLLATGELTEQAIKADELCSHRSIRLMNSVRGVWDAEFVFN
jgi:para-aminobenzoate synthetase/4-amino-4-deoxychorismate lyase